MRIMVTLVLSTAVSLVMFVDSVQINHYTLQTRLGNITGTTEQALQGTVYIFYNIPYAKSPTGNLRFAKPKEYGIWKGILDGTKPGPACMQTTIQQRQYSRLSEDCLQLNIYVPHQVRPGIRKSVMVWIHGGGYRKGSAADYDGTQLAVTGDVIVVTINYRLNIFGFGAFDDPTAKGNTGLWDQILALQWVKYNIGDYGGNPRDITIFGESSGGFSVALQSLIPGNRGLFHRAILQNGAATSFLAISRSAKNATETIGKNSGCGDEDGLLRCMRGVDARILIDKQDEYIRKLGTRILLSLPFAPVVDNDLFKRDPFSVINDKFSSEFNFFQSLDMMVGDCNMEGSLLLSIHAEDQRYYNFNITEGIPTRVLCDFLSPMIVREYMKDRTTIADAICKKYTVQGDLAEQSRQILRMYGDIFFLAPAVETLSSHANNIQGSSTYRYILSDGSLNDWYGPTPSWFQGAEHGVDVLYLFHGDKIAQSVLTNIGEESNLTQTITAYWTNFAKTGNPNGPHLPSWLPYDYNSSGIFMNLRTTNRVNGINYRKSSMDFWLEELPRMMISSNTIVGK